jgi:hypothetical protein
MASKVLDAFDDKPLPPPAFRLYLLRTSEVRTFLSFHVPPRLHLDGAILPFRPVASIRKFPPVPGRGPDRLRGAVNPQASIRSSLSVPGRGPDRLRGAVKPTGLDLQVPFRAWSRP